MKREEFIAAIPRFSKVWVESSPDPDHPRIMYGCQLCDRQAFDTVGAFERHHQECSRREADRAAARILARAEERKADDRKREAMLAERRA